MNFIQCFNFGTFPTISHNHTLTYSKNKSILDGDKQSYRLPANINKFSNLDNDSRGEWIADPFDAPNIRPNLTYPITNPNTEKVYLPPNGRCWRTTENEYYKLLSENRIVFGKTGDSKPQLKRFWSEAKEKGQAPTTLWNDVGTTTEGTRLLENIMGSKIFNNPKPVDFIQRIINLTTTENNIITDFFAGSGTTAHAVLNLNKDDNGSHA